MSNPLRRIGRTRSLARIVWSVIAMGLTHCGAVAIAAETNQASFKISGYGPIGNRQLARIVKMLQPGDKAPAAYDPSFVEDAAVIIIGTVSRDGFLRPKLTAEIIAEDGSRQSFLWTEPTRAPLPRPLPVKKVRFKIREGILYHYGSLQFEGLTALSPKEAESYFVEAGLLLPLKRSRVYTPANLKSGRNNLQEVLERRGYRDVRVEILDVNENHRTGRVDVRLKVTEGSKFMVSAVKTEIQMPPEVRDTNVFGSQAATNAVYSLAWVQDFRQAVQRFWFRQGFPDTTVDFTVTTNSIITSTTRLDVVASVVTGPKVLLNDLKFEGVEKSNLGVLESRVRLQSEKPLNRIAVEAGRVRLTRLGIFDSVAVRYDVVSTNRRDVVYLVDEGKRLDVSVLLGWGSYEMLRGGLEFEAFNVLGRAHHARLRLIQSFKASSADFIYSMPELLGEDFDVFLTANGLLREEVSFRREEYGGGAGIRRQFRGISTDVNLRYEYKVLNAADADPDISVQGLPSANVGSVIGELQHDRRDNPLYPRRGYKVFSRFEIGAEPLGGDANYERFEVATAWHVPLYDGGWLNLGLSHGVVLSAGAREEDLPFNRRFFPGGENSIRGYQEGEASPRDDEGEFVGAESFVLGNLEFEQALTRSFSFVAFVDILGFARELSNYPASTGLVSAGGGIRWKTIIGPVRLEYGHNLNPREDDPSGTVHFSLGFPF
jgi:outer membrane protein insertion porin family